MIYQQQIVNITEQSQEIEEMAHETRKLRHDMKNHFLCLQEYAKSGQCEPILAYIGKIGIFEQNNIENIVRSGNLIIDGLINKKYSIMKRQNIHFELKVECFPNLIFDDAVLSIILGNALDNAIEAEAGMLENMRWIRLELLYRKETLIIKIENPYNGKRKKDLQGQYLTTKSDRKNHGIGMESMKRAVSQYDGVMDVRDKDNIFCLEILLYK